MLRVFASFLAMSRFWFSTFFSDQAAIQESLGVRVGFEGGFGPTSPPLSVGRKALGTSACRILESVFPWSNGEARSAGRMCA
jgi:hypothetical protein